MLLVIDNYDSFTWNLVDRLGAMGVEPRVLRNDRVSAEEVRALRPRALVLSPGPGGPADSGVCRALAAEGGFSGPILGVCLGHQVLCAASGARVVRAEVPMHGRRSLVRHDGRGLFAGLPNPLVVGRYHSLVVDERSLGEGWEVSARAERGEVMAVRHRVLPRVGLQFHPESVLTPLGDRLLQAFVDRVLATEARAG